MKDIVICWKQSYDNMPQTMYDNFYGLGDMIRGTIAIYRLCKQRNYNVHIDTHLHPISKFTKQSKTIYSDYIDLNHRSIQFLASGKLNAYMDSIIQSNDTVFLMTNEMCDGPCTTDEKIFIKSILVPNDDVQDQIDTLYGQLPINYTVIHARFNDQKIRTEYSQFNLNMFDNITESSDILFSNSDYFRKNSKIPSIKHTVGHIGYEQNDDKIRNTIIDFHLIANSKYIKTYTDYGWTCGFVHWIHHIFDVPLRRL
jgi:hypothetical protein